MTNWQACKYNSLIASHNYVANKCLWRSAAVNIPRNSSFATIQNRYEAHVPMLSYKRPHDSIRISQSSHGIHSSFGGDGSKGASGNTLNWGHLKDAKADFKSPLKSYNSDKKVKHEKATSGSKSYDSWNKAAKAKLTEDEFNKRCRTNVCINCDEIGHKLSKCPKPEPSLLESVIESTIPTITRTLIPKLLSVINEYYVIKSNSEYRIDPIEHHLKDAINLNREIELFLRYCRKSTHR